MKRLTLATIAIVALVAAPVIAATPEGWHVARYPSGAARPFAAGDLIISIAMHDGATPKVIDGLVVQPDWQAPACSPAKLPERPGV